jgi:hypothetical protein
MSIWSILLPFGIVCGLSVYFIIFGRFFRFGVLHEKNLATLTAFTADGHRANKVIISKFKSAFFTIHSD